MNKYEQRDIPIDRWMDGDVLKVYTCTRERRFPSRYIDFGPSQSICIIYYMYVIITYKDEMRMRGEGSTSSSSELFTYV